MPRIIGGGGSGGGGGGSGTVTSVSVVSANGLAGSVANPTTTPAITISTTVTGLLKGNATSISAATSGTDYVIPSGNVATATALATGRTISVTGDLAYTSSSFDGTANVTGAGTLATVNSNVGTFGSVTQASVVTVNAKGLITAASNSTVTPAVGSITGLGTGIATFLGTPSSANLASAVTDETGSGALVFATSPTFVTPILGAASASSMSVSGQVTQTGAAMKELDFAANTGSAYTIDPANGKSFGLTLNAATPVLTLASNPASGVEIELAVDLIQDGTGGRVPSWANVTWASGSAPTISSTAGTTTYFAFKGTSRGWIGYANIQPTDSVTFGGLTVNGTSSLQGGQLIKTRVVTAAGAITITSADYLVIANKTSGAATTVNLPAGVTNTVFIIKDGKGDAATNNITLTPAAGNIDGASTLVISTNYGSATIVYNGTQWNVI